jgi:hypothetical protein
MMSPGEQRQRVMIIAALTASRDAPWHALALAWAFGRRGTLRIGPATHRLGRWRGTWYHLWTRGAPR